MIEVWKDIAGYEGLYQVSNLGRVKSLPRVVPHKLYGEMKIVGKELHPEISLRGYAAISLCKNGKHRHKYLHTAIAEAFIPNPENKGLVNHKNGIKTDNQIDNLEWCSHKENMRHAWSTGLCEVVNKKPINQLTTCGKLVERHLSATDAAASVSGAHQNIISCCQGKYNTAYGFKWEYA